MSYSFTRQTTGETILANDINELQVGIETIGNTDLPDHEAAADSVHGLPVVPVGGIIRRTAGGWEAVEGNAGAVLRRASGVWGSDVNWTRGVGYYSIVNQYHYAPITATANGALTLDRLIGVPIPVDVPMSIDQMAVVVTTGAAGAVLRFGLYIPNLATGVADLAAGTEQTASGATTGAVTVSFTAVEVVPPFVIVACVSQVATPGVERLISAGSGAAPSILAQRGNPAWATCSFTSNPGVTGALPPSISMAASTLQGPMIGYRRSA